MWAWRLQRAVSLNVEKTMHPPTHHGLALSLERIRALLAAQAAGPRQVASFARGAQILRGAEAGFVAQKLAGPSPELPRTLELDPGVAACLVQLIRFRRCLLLDRLEGRVSAQEQLLAVPSIGTTLAPRLVATLGLETLEDAVVAGKDGRLAACPGVGPMRARAVAEQGRSLLDPLSAAPRSTEELGDFTDLVLALDDQYRHGARGGYLPKLAPIRQNPMGESFLPVLHAEGKGWTATVHFASTSRLSAHDPRGADRVLVCLRQGGREWNRVVCSNARGRVDLPGRIFRNFTTAGADTGPSTARAA